MKRERPTPVDELLVRCLRLETAEAKAAALRPTPLAQWEALPAEAQRHAVAPLAYHRLQPVAAAAGAPQATMQALEQTHAANAWRCFRLYAALSRILADFAAAGIPVLLLKGIHLAQGVYGNVALRVVGDIDLLVHEPDMPRAEALLLAQGYAADEMNATVFAQSDRHFAYQAGDVHLELHWQLSYPNWPYRIDLAGIWERALPFRADMPARVMAPEDLLLHTCYHAACHHLFDYNGLRSLCDVVAICQRYSGKLLWGEVAARCGMAGTRNATYLALRLAVDMLAAPVPSALLQRLERPSLQRRYLAQAQARLFGNTNQGHRPDLNQDGDTSGHFGRIGAAEGAGERVRALYRAVFPGREAMARMYGAAASSPLLYALYPWRLGRLAVTRGRTLLAMAGGDRQAREWAERQARRVDRGAFTQWLSEDA